MAAKTLARAEAIAIYGDVELKLTTEGLIGRCVATVIHVSKTPIGDPLGVVGTSK